MAAPTFVGAGAGVTIATGSAACTAAGSGVAVGDLVILQVLQDGVAASAVTYSAISGIANLADTASSLTVLATDQVCGTLAKQHLRVGRATSTTCSVTVATTGDDLYYRLYVFRNVNSGTALTDILENGTAGTIANGSGATLAVADTGVTTLGTDRLALQFVGIDDDNPIGGFTGMTGGVWSEAVAEFASATGTDGCIQLQLGYIGDSVGAGGSTIDSAVGNDVSLTAKATKFIAPATGIITLCQVNLMANGAPTDDMVVEIRTDSGSNRPSSTVVGTSVTLNVTATSLTTHTAAVAAPVTSGTVYWIVVRRSGAINATNYYSLEGGGTTTGTSVYNGSLWSAAAAASYAHIVLVGSGAAGTINGGSYSMVAVDNWGVIGFALKPLPSGPATLFGVTASSYTVSRVTAATKKTFGQVAMPTTFAAVVAGIATVPAVTHYGQVAVSLTFGETTQATRRAFGATATPLTFTKAVQASRKTFGATATPFTFGETTAASRRTFGQVARPFTVGFVTAGIATTGAVTYFGQVAAPFTFGETTAARRRTFSTLAAPFTFTKAVQAQRRTTGATATPFTFSAVTSSRKQYGRLVAPFVFGELTQARKHTYGIVTRPFTITIVTQGVGFTGAATYFGATAIQLTFGEVTAGRKKTFAQTAAPFTFSKAVQAQRRTFAQLVVPYTFARATQAQRKTTGQITRPFTVAFATAGVSTVGIVTHYGLLTMPLQFTKDVRGRKKTFALVAAPYLFGEQTQATRRTFGATATPLTMSFATSGLAILAPILNYAQDIRWGAIQADAVYVGDELVWTPAETRKVER